MPNNNPLPIDNNCTVAEEESKFLEQYGAVDDKTLTVLYSRISGKRYNYKPTVIEDFDASFTYGHTLSILPDESYAIPLIIDIDCPDCKKNNERVNHNIIPQVKRIVKSITEFITKIVKKINLRVYQNICSVHIYGDVTLSVSLYYQLLSKLRLDSKLNIDTPEYLPLPASSKDGINIYKIIKPSTTECKLGNSEFFDNIFYAQTRTEDSPCIFTLWFNDDRIYYATWIAAVPRTSQIFDKGIIKIDNLLPQGLIRDKIQNYFERFLVIRDVSKPIEEEEDEAMELDEIFPQEHVETETHSDQEFNFLPNKHYPELENPIIIEFMEKFNNKIGNGDWQGIKTSQLFVLYCERDGYANLQHLCVALHKFIIAVNPNLQFEDYIHEVFDSAEESPVLDHFLKTCNMSICSGYTYSWESMLSFIKYHTIIGTTPSAHLPEVIKAAFIKEIQPYTLEALTNWPKNSNVPLESVIQQALVNVIFKLKLFVRYEKSNTTLWYDNNGSFIQLKSTQDTLKQKIQSIFSCLGATFTIRASVRANIIDHVIGSLNQLMDQQICDGSEFLFPTTYGIFNSITGLYSALTPLVPMTKFRGFGIIPPDVQGVVRGWFDQVNEYMLTLHRMGDMMFKMLKSVGSQYSDFIVIPALIQLRYISRIDETDIIEYFKILQNAQVSSGTHLKLIVDYYPFDLDCYRRGKAIFDKSISSYDQLRLECLPVDINHSVEDWTEFINEESPRVEFTIDPELSHIENVMLNLDLTETQVVDMTILLLFYNKCEPFANLTAALGVETLPDYLPKCLEYSFTPEYQETSRETMRKNFEAVIESHLDGLTQSTSICVQKVLDLFMRIGMTANFDAKIMMHIFTHAASMFVPTNINKKFVLYYGVGDTGKSYLADIYEAMLSPAVSKLNDFKAANERSGVSLASQLVIINEVKCIDSTSLKTTTGNDSCMTSEFYSQTMHLKSKQGMMMGCTNVHIKFSDAADITSVNRLHVIQVSGRQIPHTTSKRSLFDAMVSRSFYNNMITKTAKELAAPMAIIAYGVYRNLKDENGHVLFNTNDEIAVRYRGEVYSRSNRLYRYLKSSNIVYMENFKIKTKVLIDLLDHNFEVYGGAFKSVKTLMDEFCATYDVDLKSSYISHFQKSDALEYTFFILKSEDCEDSIITMNDVKKRASTLDTKLDVNNAIDWFTREYARYYINGSYVNLQFVNNLPIEQTNKQFSDDEDDYCEISSMNK